MSAPGNLLVALTTTYTTNLLNPASGLIYTITHVRVLNKTGAAQTFRLFKGATGANAAGSEFVGYDRSVAANNEVDWYGQMKLSSSDFLVGGANAASALTLEVDYDIDVTR